MYKAKINNDQTYHVELNQDGTSGTLNEQAFELDLQTLKPGSYHLIRNDQSYNIEVLKADADMKEYELKINGTPYTVNLEDRFDTLLKNLGMDNLNSQVVKELKAPMPGLVLDIAVAPGTEVKKGDPLLVLEAMKMENVLKSPTDAVVKSVAVELGAAVEKNQVLVNFE